jgi:integrase/recombinase XerD
MARAPWDMTPEMFLSVSETERLVRHVRNQAQRSGARERLSRHLDRVIVELLLFSGLRCSEFCAVRVADTVIATSAPSIVVRGKRGSGRTVWLPGHLNRLIETFAAEVRPHLLPEHVHPDEPEQPLVFSERRRPYERTGLYRRVVRILTEAGLGSRASVQLLRHTYGYLAYLHSGGNLLFVQRQLGHAHPIITSIYAQFVEESYAALADAVGQRYVPERRPVIRKKPKVRT